MNRKYVFSYYQSSVVFGMVCQNRNDSKRIVYVLDPAIVRIRFPKTPRAFESYFVLYYWPGNTKMKLYKQFSVKQKHVRRNKNTNRLFKRIFRVINAR